MCVLRKQGFARQGEKGRLDGMMRRKLWQVVMAAVCIAAVSGGSVIPAAAGTAGMTVSEEAGDGIAAGDVIAAGGGSAADRETAGSQDGAAGIALALEGLESAVRGENIVYVSTEGKEGAQGSFEDPFRTIQEARDYLKGKDLEEGNRGIVYIRKGVYYVDSSDPVIGLGAEDSYVTYAAYRGEEVELSGLFTLENSHFRKLDQVDLTQEKYSSSARLPEGIKDKVYVYDLGAENIPVGSIKKNGFNFPLQSYPPELVVDGSTQILAEYPNLGGSIDVSKYMMSNTLLAGQEKNNATPSGAQKVIWELARAAGGSTGAVVRNYYFDKTDEPRTFDEMMEMEGPVFYVVGEENQTGGWFPLVERYSKWAPPSYEGEPQAAQPQVHPGTDHTKYETDGWLYGYFENDYAFDQVRIYSVDTAKQLIRCKYPSIQGTQDKRIRLIGQNLLCELDAEGEYYIDRYNGNNILYYYPKGGSLDDKKVSLTSADQPFFKLEGAREVVISGLSFTGTTSNAMELYDCESCRIEDCEFYNISLDAIRIGQNNGTITSDPSYVASRGGHNNLVTGCYIHDMGGGGVYLAGGECKTLERGNNVVEYCEFGNISQKRTYTPAVYLEGCGNTMRYNYMHDAPHITVQIMGNDMTVEQNVFRNCAWNASDTGVIYAGRCFTWLGNEISYNLFENNRKGGYGIYLDDGMTGALIHHNIFKDTKGYAINSNSGFGHQISDNVSMNTPGIYYNAFTSYQSRPIPNEKVHKYRWYYVLRPESAVGEQASDFEKSFSNSAENIEKWYSHYEGIYPTIRQWYFPEEDVDIQENDYWKDPNAVFAPSYQVLRNTVKAGGGGIVIKRDEVSQQNQNGSMDLDVIECGDILLDLNTGRFAENTPLTGIEKLGSEWVKAWNETMKLDQAGRRPSSAADKTELIEEIALAMEELLRTEIYTPESLERLKEAIVQAQTVAEDREASDDAVRAQVKAIRKALLELEEIPEPVKPQVLKELIAIAMSLEAGKYTEESFQAVSEALEPAEECLALAESGSRDITQEDVDSAALRLLTAMEGLIPVDVTVIDWTQLMLAVREAESLNQEEYTEESFAVLEAALANARVLLDAGNQDADVSDGDVSGGNADSKKNTFDTVSGGDLAVLSETEGTVSDSDMSGRNAITQADVDNAVLKLRAAIRQLVKKPAPEADKAALRDAVEQAASIDGSQYTSESYGILLEAIDTAQAVLEDRNASQRTVDAVLRALNSAVRGLKPADGGQGDGSGDSNDPGGDGNESVGPEENAGGSTGDGGETADTAVVVRSPKTYDSSRDDMLKAAAAAGILLTVCAGTAGVYLKKKKER